MKPATSISPVELIADINEQFSRSDDVRSNIRSALEILCRGLNASFAFYAETDENNELGLAESYGLGLAEFRRFAGYINSPLFTETLERNVEATIDYADFSRMPDPAREGRNVLSIVPAAAGKKNIGIIGLGFETGYADHIKLLTLVGSMIAQALRIEHGIRGERERLREENVHLKQELKEKYDFSHIVGKSNGMKLVYEQITQVAKSNATVLLRGESGTGKEMIANAIHYNSLRSKKPLIKINCAALPETLIESELFGHEKGAFTGADRLKKGRFELAEGGTLFLDEIGDIPLQTQIKLLRAVQEREFERVGGTETIKANIRLITATNKNLEEAIARGVFREDLYYRLNVFSIFLPPLRERKSDVLLLAEHFLEKYELEHNKRIRRISTPAIDMLMSYHFPGNVRELENAIERAVLVCDSNVIHGHHLPPTLQTAEVSGTVTDLSLEAAVEAFERDLIQDALKSNNGNVAKTARVLVSTQRILGYKIKKYGIDTMRFRK
ncbi:MAG: sigma 54-interacting transcriptional regulator [Pyrinomonadaceae bacterium]